MLHIAGVLVRCCKSKWLCDSLEIFVARIAERSARVSLSTIE